MLAEHDARATPQGQASAILTRDLAVSGAAACVTKTLQWNPSDRHSCEELLQDAWMQASGASGGSQDSAGAGAVDEARLPLALMDARGQCPALALGGR